MRIRVSAIPRPATMFMSAWMCAALFSSTMQASAADAVRDELGRMSLEDLADVQVTSVSKVSEPLRAAPATVYVITHDDILRSGATSLPEVLRLAPNLLVTQHSSSGYAASARGFGGNPDVQNFSNKLLMLIDGRSVYSPLYSGIYYDAQDVVLDDIDRIEVLSGPGATLWGANAVDGVINIITRPTYLTTGTRLSAGAGTHERNASARFGGRINEDTSFRIYGKGFERDATLLDDGSPARDDWYKGQAGFRLDWSGTADEWTAQGDVYRGVQNQEGVGKGDIFGANVLGRWQHRGAKSDLQVQVYYDQTQRAAPHGGVAFVLHTADIELQQTLAPNARNRIVWGAGYRDNRYRITNSAALAFVPPARNLSLFNVFVQDTVLLTDKLKLTLGVKAENPAYTDWELQPEARLAWQPSDRTLWWMSAARAVRTATPFDVDVVETLGTTVFLTGNPEFQPEEVVAYEIGFRGEPADSISVSIAAFLNRYDDLRTIEPASGSVFLPLRWDNLMQGRVHGLTAWAKWSVARWWRLSPGVTLQHKDLRFSPGASQLLSLEQAGNDPGLHATLASSMDLGSSITLDAHLRYVGTRPDPAAEQRYDLSARLGWQVTPAFQLGFAGFNLLHGSLAQYPAPNGRRIERSAFLEARWTP